MKVGFQITLLVAVCIAVGIGLGMIINAPTILQDDVSNPLATLIAAFVGAWAAFRLQHQKELDDQRRARIAAGNRALFTLLQQANTLKLFQRDFIDPNRDHPGRHLQMQPVLPYEDTLHFEVNQLDFLATPKHQQVLFDLVLEESRYREAIKSINTRSTLHLEQIQPKLSAAGIVHGQEYTGEQYHRDLGDFLYQHLRSTTDAVVFHVDTTVASLVAMKNRLRVALLELYPKERFIDFELLTVAPNSRFQPTGRPPAVESGLSAAQATTLP